MSKEASKTPRPINYPGYTKHYTRKDADRKWILVDAKGQSVGRLATQVAMLLRGKHKPTFTRHDDVGDFVVVINAQDLELRGNEKAKKKIYYRHTNYFGHLRERTGEQMLQRNPTTVITKAVYGMIPHGALGNRIIKKLKVYAGSEHPHRAQNPQPFTIKT
jgi:large subunit ribosomal protein L13